MPRFEGGPENEHLQVYYFPVKYCDRELLGYASAVDTDEKWVEIFIPRLRSAHEDGVTASRGRFMAADGGLLKARLYINFDVVDKRDKITLFSVRQ